MSKFNNVLLEFVVPAHALVVCLREALPDRDITQADLDAVSNGITLNLEQHWAAAFEQAVEDFTKENTVEEVNDD